MNDEMTVEIPAARLLDTLRENRAEHVRLYAEAMVAYREAVIKEMARRLKVIRAGGEIDRNFNALVAPRSFETSFDTVITMLTWHGKETVSLSQDEFEKYVLNDWEWKGAFASSTLGYTVSA